MKAKLVQSRQHQLVESDDDNYSNHIESDSGSEEDLNVKEPTTTMPTRRTKKTSPPTDNCCVEPMFAEGFSRNNNRQDIPFEVTKVSWYLFTIPCSTHV